MSNFNLKEKDMLKDYLKIKENFIDFPLREKKQEIKIGVIAGGVSSEREVSLSTGRGIYNALLNLGYNACLIDFTGDILSLIDRINVAFIALHGKFGEDGTIQGFLELLKIPYTGSGVLSSALAMDKVFSKKIFKYENISTPDFITLNKIDILKKSNFNDKKFLGLDAFKINSLVNEKIGYPIIVKPNRGGSSIGVTIIESENPDLLKEAVIEAFEYDNIVIIEKFIRGRLLTVSIIGQKPIALPIIEIKPKSGFYDYKSKYTPGLTEYIVPAKIEEELADLISKTAIKCHQILDCSSLSRVDLVLSDSSNSMGLYKDKSQNLINILEVNTIPGMTPTSLVPKAAAACGINFDTLVEIILNSASLKL